MYQWDRPEFKIYESPIEARFIQLLKFEFRVRLPGPVRRFVAILKDESAAAGQGMQRQASHCAISSNQRHTAYKSLMR